MNAPISSLMRGDVCRVGLDDTLAAVEQTLLDRRRSWVPVVDGDDTVIGVISATDLLRFHADGGDPAAVRAWQLCTYKPLVVSPQAPIEEVARTMLQHDVHHVAVVDEGGLRGVVSSMDFVRAFAS